MGATEFFGFTLPTMICYALCLSYLGLMGVQGDCETNRDCVPDAQCRLIGERCFCLTNITFIGYPLCNGYDGRKHSGMQGYCETNRDCSPDAQCRLIGERCFCFTNRPITFTDYPLCNGNDGRKHSDVQGYCESNSDCAPKSLCMSIGGNCYCVINMTVTDYSLCNAKDGRKDSDNQKTARCKTRASCGVDEFCTDEGALGCKCTHKTLAAGRNACLATSPPVREYINADENEYNLFVVGLPIIFCGIFIPLVCCIATLALWYRRRYRIQRRQLEAAVSSGEPAPSLPKAGIVPGSLPAQMHYPNHFQPRYDYGSPSTNQFGVPLQQNVPLTHHGYGDRPSYPTSPYPVVTPSSD